MADDGMILNFSIPDTTTSSTTSRPKITGGSWRDRLNAKKALRHKPGKAKSNGTRTPNYELNGVREERIYGTGANAGFVNGDRERERASKRVRVADGEYRERNTGSAQRGEGGHTHGFGGGQPAQKYGKDFVSSLFTQNPEAKTEVVKAEKEDPSMAAKPSNAPLVDGIDTFTSLGLSARLATHLLTKLDFKTPTGIQKASMQTLLKEDADAFIQAQTGSGKTLAYLLPLVQKVMNLSQQKKSDGTNIQVSRNSGLFGIILAPTRELCDQISTELEKLLRCAHWIVAGKVHGGENMNHEKDRIRKGLNILVATPGRLADHLENTEKLDIGNVRWLILDEGDRLMDLGFEDEIQKIVQKLDLRHKRPSLAFPGLPKDRTTYLVSATMKMNVQKLGEISLKDAILVKADETEEEAELAKKDEDAFLAPAQLKQSYAVVPAKLRLVTLTALLRRLFMRRGSVMKAIIFVSCADSVEFHYEVFTRKLEAEAEDEKDDKKSKKDKRDDYKAKKESSKSDSDDEPEKEVTDAEKKAKAEKEKTANTIATATTLSSSSNTITLHKLHGSLPQHTRTATLAAFAKNKDASILICTDVAARGLDLPNVDYVLEYDPPFSSEDHLHRIGRTARLGRDGRACIFLLPGNEEGYIDILAKTSRDNGKSITQLAPSEILQKGFTDPTTGAIKSHKLGYENLATDFQLEIERWCIANPNILEMARRAYQSHVRAYATHVSAERSMFNIQDLHLGHLAKAFALRDKPGSIKVPGLRQTGEATKKGFKAGRGATAVAKEGDEDKTQEQLEARKKMNRGMNALAKAGASEFNIA